MTQTAMRPRPGAADPRVDLRLARLHLRMGQLGLARAELESLAGRGQLDSKGLLALAEARWRTGDLTGAGEAAEAYLTAGAEATIALVIAAEATAAIGRPAEARRIAARALERGDVPLDRIFAGMPRSQVWPADAADAGQPAGTLFGGPAPEDEVTGRGGRSTAAREAPYERVGVRATADSPGLWDGEDGEADDLPEPADELAAAQAALEAGSLAEASVRLALVLRSAPQLAPMVLGATEPAELRSPEIEVVRGDAFRLVGHELDARRAYAVAGAAFRGLAPAPGGSDGRRAEPDPGPSTPTPASARESS